MVAVDRRAFAVGLMIAVVGVFGEVGWFVVYLGAGLVLGFSAMSLSWDVGLRVRGFEALLWIIVGWGMVAAVLNSGDIGASKATLASWGGALLIWAVMARAGGRGRRVVSSTLMWVGILLGFSLVAGFLDQPKLITNDNITAALIVSVIPLASGHIRSTWRAGVAVGLMSVPVLLTGSRAGVLALVMITVLLWPKGRMRLWVFASVGLCGGVAVVWRLVSRPDSLAWHRWRIWGAILESIGDRPWFGIGAGGVAEAMGPYRLEHFTEVGRWGHVIGGAENMPLGLAVRVGVPALLLASVACGLWFIKSRRPASATAAVLGAMAAMGLFHDFLSEPAVLWWWAAVMGLVTIRSPEVPGFNHRDRKLARSFGALAVGGVVAWALVQPAWAQWLWWNQGPSSERVGTVIRAEPWFAEPMRWQIESLLAERQWMWAQASEALSWSDRQLEIRRGSAAAWGLHGKVNARIIDEFGAWPATIERARSGFARAAAIEPRLPWYPYDQALMERGLGNAEDALTLVKRSVELEPAFVRGWLLLARLELDRGRLGEAQAAFERGLGARQFGGTHAGIAYHHDLILCPEWQLQEIRRALE